MIPDTVYPAIKFSLGMSLLIVSSLCNASDLAREIRMKQQVADYIMQGDAVMLNDSVAQHEFLSIYTEAESDTPKGAVIIMHGRGYHPNWPELVYPLRTSLPEHGWHTLSIQMPVLDTTASFYDYMDIIEQAHPRINAAIEFLQQQEIESIILLAHSCSVHMAVDWLHKHPNTDASGFIGIGMGSTDKGQPMRQPFPLQAIKIPILDIRGENDYPAVKRNAPRRWENIQQAGNPLSAQRVVKDARHYFTDHSDALLQEVVDWLDKVYAAQMDKAE
jgi:pimeloyl-ACP methyl ester carboxylesterase